MSRVSSGILSQPTSIGSRSPGSAAWTSKALMARGVRSPPRIARIPTALRSRYGAAKLVPSCGVSLSPERGLSCRRRLVGVFTERVSAHARNVGDGVLGQADLLGQHHRLHYYISCLGKHDKCRSLFSYSCQFKRAIFGKNTDWPFTGQYRHITLNCVVRDRLIGATRHGSHLSSGKKYVTHDFTRT